MRHIFVSGHVDLTNAEFVEHYAPRLTAVCQGAERAVSHIGDAPGADLMAQEFLEGFYQEYQAENVVSKLDRRSWVVVYHMFDAPRNICGKPARMIQLGEFQLLQPIGKGVQLRGGFASDEERDAAMTAATTEDIAWVRPGREHSGTAKNLARRKLIEQSDQPFANSVISMKPSIRCIFPPRFTNESLQRASVVAEVQWHRFGEDWCVSVETSGGDEQHRIAAAARELALLDERVTREVEEITKRQGLLGWSGTVCIGTTENG